MENFVFCAVIIQLNIRSKENVIAITYTQNSFYLDQNVL